MAQQALSKTPLERKTNPYNKIKGKLYFDPIQRTMLTSKPSKLNNIASDGNRESQAQKAILESKRKASQCSIRTRMSPPGISFTQHFSFISVPWVLLKLNDIVYVTTMDSFEL
ncbi:unnamed protein product [Leptidea sinapis]|uniref:Uncharacterized protein n=1 Tax=Leptidea sinapis TaxID=189913 RepID=A0A5E4Q0L2_9NEOP|nr:unnamed protein product [Leptidea sinapis]